MVECGAEFIPEDVLVAALNHGHQALQGMVDLQEQIAAEVGKPKRDYPRFELDEDL